jgi:hypothetical protein
MSACRGSVRNLITSKRSERFAARGMRCSGRDEGAVLLRSVRRAAHAHKPRPRPSPTTPPSTSSLLVHAGSGACTRTEVDMGPIKPKPVSPVLC